MQGSDTFGSVVLLKRPQDVKSQAWVYALDHTLRLPESDMCLIALDGAVTMTGCLPAAEQDYNVKNLKTRQREWDYHESTQQYVSRFDGRCLMSQGAGSPLMVRACDANDPLQKWSLPK
ncbi:ricin-type beta-trefoil lectin domain protein [Luethyella okanaganae]|uniref:Ricin-type beta-trefoil lectin domain protein n=1 Tax=Luethyella okanaganae TaxID=69372 RepID=A0ABW1VL67_9MICO